MQGSSILNISYPGRLRKQAPFLYAENPAFDAGILALTYRAKCVGNNKKHRIFMPDFYKKRRT